MGRGSLQYSVDSQSIRTDKLKSQHFLKFSFKGTPSQDEQETVLPRLTPLDNF